jgi:CheY-like chemotaxis protein/tRNA A-37 threonylcarbamoyl transferase component Bud32
MQTSQNPQPVTREAFLASLSECGLFSPMEVVDVEIAHADADGSALVSALVQAGKLTPYQADAVLHRRFDELRIGKYDVLALLGKGGMGTVYKARHRRMKRDVALKVLSPEVASQGSFVQRFQREVETIARLQHPNVVMAFDADEDKCGHFLVMEFVNGHDLASEVQRSGPLSVAGAVECIVQAARGLEYAHSHNLVHRDVKPANLLIDAAGLVKVADLGLARLSAGASEPGASLTQAGGIVGTIDFLAPEQAVDATAIDGRADVYSLGCTLFYLLTGKALYQATSIMALLLKHRDASIPSLRAERPDVSPALEAIFVKAVAKRPEDRYQSMTELIAALESLRSTTALPQSRGVAPKEAILANDATLAAEHAAMQPTKEGPAPKLAPGVGDPMPTPSDAGRVAGLTVVLAEPSRTQGGIVRKYLQQLGVADVHGVTSGRQALATVETSGAQVILSAMHLADGTGVQLAQSLRAAGGSAGFVLMTSESDLTEAAAALASLPGTVVLSKPFDLGRLARSLVEATGRVAEDQVRGS